ncbi:MAG TPA: hypothetical protein VHG09_04560 [Longimicrobiales bacterium]|nr:hypothetical protein [Longimicrobiales bacterium]
MRLGAEALAGDDIGLVRDFDIAGDTIYLLDVTGRVAVVERDTSGLRLTGHFARQGAGPGELLRPSGIALAAGSVAVMDGTRIQFFSRSGEFMQSTQITLPCMMVLPAIAAARDGLFVHGGCLQRGVVTDTMMAVLAWSPDTSAWEMIVQTPRFTTDGSVGTVFGVKSLLTTGSNGRHVFGGGEANCIWNVLDEGGRPHAEQTCPAAGVLYRADPPPAVAQRLRAGKIAGMNVEWPETLPVYMERFVARDETILLRPWSADSVVLQSAAPASVDLAVAPLEGLIGCKAGGCLWLLEDQLSPRLIVLDRARIEAMIDEAVK